MIKGILFDLDGTLLDRDQSLVAFLRNQYHRIQAFQCVEEHFFIQKFIELDQKGYVLKDEVYQQLLKELKINLPWQVLLDDYIDSFQHFCIGFPGLIDTLEFLKEEKLKLGIITNGFANFQMNNIRGLKIEHYFDEILISESEGLRKPKIEIFQRALERLGLQPQEAIYVGDHPINDIEASVNAGMIGIWKEDNYFEMPPNNHLTIKELREIRDIVEGNSL
ncbi:HAD family hydrolase [Paenibacillus sp. SN-8-1]|uniref:HAD family hydrolase n=1 Tax=Paenibacillus sp. SN-8-1 TaxID=3435409 RepID=UPI003D9A8336